MIFSPGDRVRYECIDDDGLPLVRYGFIGGVAGAGGPVVVMLDGELGGDVVTPSRSSTSPSPPSSCCCTAPTWSTSPSCAAAWYRCGMPRRRPPGSTSTRCSPSATANATLRVAGALRTCLPAATTTCYVRCSCRTNLRWCVFGRSHTHKVRRDAPADCWLVSPSCRHSQHWCCQQRDLLAAQRLTG